MDLAGKVAVITGGAVRIGRALTLALAEAGCHVFIHYGHSDESAQEVQALAGDFGIEAAIYSANLNDGDATREVIPAACKRFGHVDILINNAGIFDDEESFTSANLETWDKLFNVNLRAPFLLSREFAAQVPQDGHGKIININDNRLQNDRPDHFVYRLTKAGLWRTTAMMANELAPRITVNAVALGAILPPPGADNAHLLKIAEEMVPLKRPGNTRIVADSVLHLLAQDFLTGVTIPIDGGQFIP